jgi:excisionase family DNA binding protein
MRPETVAQISELLARAGRSIASFAGELWNVVSAELQESKPSANEADNESISVREAATMLGVRKWRVYQMIKQGILPASRPSPRTIRLRRGAVLEFIRTGQCADLTKPAKVLSLKRRGVIESAASNLRKEA